MSKQFKNSVVSEVVKTIGPDNMVLIVGNGSGAIGGAWSKKSGDIAQTLGMGLKYIQGYIGAVRQAMDDTEKAEFDANLKAVAESGDIPMERRVSELKGEEAIADWLKTDD